MGYWVNTEADHGDIWATASRRMRERQHGQDLRFDRRHDSMLTNIRGIAAEAAVHRLYGLDPKKGETFASWGAGQRYKPFGTPDIRLPDGREGEIKFVFERGRDLKTSSAHRKRPLSDFYVLVWPVVGHHPNNFEVMGWADRTMMSKAPEKVFYQGLQRWIPWQRLMPCQTLWTLAPGATWVPEALGDPPKYLERHPLSQPHPQPGG